MPRYLVFDPLVIPMAKSQVGEAAFMVLPAEIYGHFALDVLKNIKILFKGRLNTFPFLQQIWLVLFFVCIYVFMFYAFDLVVYEFNVCFPVKRFISPLEWNVLYKCYAVLLIAC